MDEASYCYRVLGRDFADVVVRDGKTGGDLYNERFTDKRLLMLPSLDEPVQAWPTTRKITVKQDNVNSPQFRQLYFFELDGEPLAFFQNHRLAVDGAQHQFKVIERASQKEEWSSHLTQTNFQQLFQQMGGQQPGSNALRNSFSVAGHLVVLPLGHMVFGIDPVGHRLLWEKSLLGQAPPQQTNFMIDPRDGAPTIVYSDGWIQKLGQTFPVHASYVCLHTRDGLLALDPLSGRTLWTRSDVSNRTQVFGDEEHIYLVELGADNSTPSATRAFRACDGVSVRVPDFTALYQKKLRVLGGTLLLSDPEGRGLTLRLYDIQTGKDLWKKTFPASSVMMQTEDPRLAGIAEPDGKVTALELPSGKELLQTRIQGSDVDKVQSIHLLQDRGQFYVLCNRPVNQAVNPWGMPIPALMATTGLRSLPVNGNVYAFFRESGKLNWQRAMPSQCLVLEQYQDMPMLLFATQNRSQVAMGGVQMNVSVQSIDKGTGKLQTPSSLSNLPNGTQFHSLNVDLRLHKVELVAYNMKITHAWTDDEGAATPEKKETPSEQPGSKLRRTTTACHRRCLSRFYLLL